VTIYRIKIAKTGYGDAAERALQLEGCTVTIDEIAKALNDLAKEHPTTRTLQLLRDALTDDAWSMLESLVEETLP
jgi:hypothetical protein